MDLHTWHAATSVTSHRACFPYSVPPLSLYSWHSGCNSVFAYQCCCYWYLSQEAVKRCWLQNLCVAMAPSRLSLGGLEVSRCQTSNLLKSFTCHFRAICFQWKDGELVNIRKDKGEDEDVSRVQCFSTEVLLRRYNDKEHLSLMFDLERNIHIL